MHPTAVEVTHKAMENIGPGVGERPGLTSGGSSGFDVPGEQTRFRPQDGGRGEAGQPGTAFDGPWEASPPQRHTIQVDVFALAEPECYSLIGEVKNRQTDRYTDQEAAAFLEKAKTLMALEAVERAVMFVFSRSGFTREALAYMEARRMAWADDERWVQESGYPK